MPIYEYQCESCGHQLEAIQKMSDPALKDCPACGKGVLKKLISATAFQLKGTGWYATDFKGGGKKKDASESSGSDTKPEKTPTPEKKKTGGCGGGCGDAH